ncbi:MAG TPA: prepilin-type N-terminal cleavage/methylation domain-containing protein [Armatimonadota bacterium]|jgi:prepilin-type N-terminal cleavage/methylation domain-containing protein/prepilin-type processing-associated H-X9-DG protein
MKKRGFTLIELLVVIAIIAILAAILFPVFAKARDRAMLSTCLSNNKQLGTAFAMYLGDTDSREPFWADGNRPPAPFTTITHADGSTETPSRTTWDVYIWRYVNNKTVFTCPKNTSKWGKALGGTANPIRSYSFPQNINGILVGRIKNPAKTVQLFEKGSEVCGVTSDAPGEYFGQTVSGYTDITKSSANEADWKLFHGRGKVFLFVDGHVAWYPVWTSKTAFNNDNPFGYYFPNSGASGGWPKGAAGMGYCGPLDSLHAGDAASGPSEPGANLPD